MTTNGSRTPSRNPRSFYSRSPKSFSPRSPAKSLEKKLSPFLVAEAKPTGQPSQLGQLISSQPSQLGQLMSSQPNQLGQPAQNTSDLKSRLESTRQTFQESLQLLKQTRPQAEVRQILEETQHNLNLITANLVDRGVMRDHYQPQQQPSSFGEANPGKRLREEIRQLEVQLEQKKAELFLIGMTMKSQKELPNPASLAWKRLSTGLLLSLFVLLFSFVLGRGGDNDNIILY